MLFMLKFKHPDTSMKTEIVNLYIDGSGETTKTGLRPNCTNSRDNKTSKKNKIYISLILGL